MLLDILPSGFVAESIGSIQVCMTLLGPFFNNFTLTLATTTAFDSFFESIPSQGTAQGIYIHCNLTSIKKEGHIMVSIQINLLSLLHVEFLDYIPTAESFTFTPTSEMTECITVTLVQDDILELPENFAVSYSSSKPSITPPSNGVFITITDSISTLYIG